MKICPAWDLRKYYIIKANIAFVLYVSHCSRLLIRVKPFNFHNSMDYTLYFLYRDQDTDAWKGDDLVQGHTSDTWHGMGLHMAVWFQSLCPPHYHWEAMWCIHGKGANWELGSNPEPALRDCAQPHCTSGSHLWDTIILISQWLYNLRM